MDKPLISIVVPIYKVEKYLEHCVKSILNQTITDIEVILVDDGSPDNCGAICDELAKTDSRIKVIHKPNGGLSDARNAGIDIAEGKYIGLVDSDDYIAPTMYEKLLKAIEENKADASMCYACNIYDDDMEYRPCKTGDVDVFEGDAILDALFDKKLNNFAWNKLYKRELFDNIRYPFDKIYEDLFTTYKIFGNCKKVALDTSQMYYYRIRRDSIMGKARKVINTDKFEAFSEITEYTKGMKVHSKAVLYMQNDLMSDVFKVLVADTIDENRSFFNLLKTFVKGQKREITKPYITLWIATHCIWVLKLRYKIQKLIGA